MNFDYDPEADAAYLAIVQPGALSERQISGITTEKMEGEIEIDIDENGKIIGIEFVNASLILPSDFLKKSKPDIIGIIVTASLFLRKSLLKLRLNQTPTALSN